MNQINELDGLSFKRRLNATHGIDYFQRSLKTQAGRSYFGLFRKGHMLFDVASAELLSNLKKLYAKFLSQFIKLIKKKTRE